jgi:hypothetical protein
LLIALLRWRRPEARVLAALACVPQTMRFIDQLPLLAVAQSFRQSLLVSLLSYVPLFLMPFLPLPIETGHSRGNTSDDPADRIRLLSAVSRGCAYAGERGRGAHMA